MSQRNKNNSIIFLTTLSVYLGFVLVGGASPQVLAQSLNIAPISKEATVLAGDKIISINARWAVELEKIIAGSSASAHILGNMIFPDEGAGEWRFQIAEGNTEAIDFLRKHFFLAPEISPANLPLPYRKISFEVETNHTEIKFEWRTTFRNSQDAAEFGKSYAYILSHREKFGDEIGSAEKIFLENTKSGLDNNQVTIVTRLPRGSLDELLKQDAKANGK